MNTTILPPLLDLGVGKAATAHIIQSAANAYEDRGFKYATSDSDFARKQLTLIDSILATSGRPMVVLYIEKLMERRTGNTT